MTFYSLHAPDRAETPVVVEVPHAGLAIPERVASSLIVPREAVLRDSDLYVDRIWDEAPAHGATLLVAKVSRYVIDLNRAPDDVDRDTVPDHPAPRPTQARGVVWRVTTDGRPALRSPLRYADLRDRLDAFHDPYHRALRETLERKRERFGYAILVAAHSMPSTSRDGATRRADVVPGTRGRTSADPRVIDVVERHFRAAGLSVRHDDPYRGGWTTGHYGRPDEGVHAIQIELNRALYVDEPSSRPKDAELAWLRDLAGTLLDRLAHLDLAPR
ncbi:N-formylglutamate amidohydrolase [Sandaracinus amylolyticus]|uniref:N-formylglutamate deformylase n=1 Tax=Sandaracinus amylolyticus TaxID=927083 RepID=A0A0F6YK94_9BACT|nr:N-formylglutamate amidohydrolase [Sandaracinus amylolyticus]AKF08616.1 N-formylglutamate deformylase [Sandaracinus amylolyticus]